MGEIAGVVGKVEKLEKRNGDDKPTYSVSIESVGFLFRGENPPPSSATVHAQYSVYWPESGRPIRWLADDWRKVTMMG